MRFFGSKNKIVRYSNGKKLTGSPNIKFSMCCTLSFSIFLGFFPLFSIIFYSFLFYFFSFSRTLNENGSIRFEFFYRNVVSDANKPKIITEAFQSVVKSELITNESSVDTVQKFTHLLLLKSNDVFGPKNFSLSITFITNSIQKNQFFINHFLEKNEKLTTSITSHWTPYEMENYTIGQTTTDLETGTILQETRNEFPISGFEIIELSNKLINNESYWSLTESSECNSEDCDFILSYSSPVLDYNGNLVAYLSNRFVLSDFSNVLRENTIKKGISFIIDKKTGNFICSSSSSIKSTSFNSKTNSSELQQAVKINDPVVKEISKYIKSKFGDDYSKMKPEKSYNERLLVQGINYLFNFKLNYDKQKEWIIISAFRDIEYYSTFIIISVCNSVICVIVLVLSVFALIFFSFNTKKTMKKMIKQMESARELRFDLEDRKFSIFSEIRKIQVSFYRLVSRFQSYSAFLPYYFREDCFVNSNSINSSTDRTPRLPRFVFGKEFVSAIKKRSIPSSEKRTSLDNSVRGVSVVTIRYLGKIFCQDKNMNKNKYGSPRKEYTFGGSNSSSIYSYSTVDTISTNSSFRKCGFIHDFSVFLQTIEMYLFRFCANLISFDENFIVIGFNTFSIENQDKDHFKHAVNFSFEIMEKLSLMYRLQIGISSDESGTVTTFGSGENRIRKVIGNVETISKTFSVISECENSIIMDFEYARKISKDFVVIPVNIVFIPSLRGEIEKIRRNSLDNQISFNSTSFHVVKLIERRCCSNQEKLLETELTLDKDFIYYSNLFMEIIGKYDGGNKLILKLQEIFCLNSIDNSEEKKFWEIIEIYFKEKKKRMGNLKKRMIYVSVLDTI